MYAITLRGVTPERVMDSKNSKKVMAIISLNYNPRSVQARKAIDYMLSTGVFTRAETPMQRRIRKSVESAEHIAQDIRMNGTKGYQTLDGLIEELRGFVR